MRVYIYVSDWYDGEEQLYCGNSIRAAKHQIRQRIEDTAAECDLCVRVVKVHDYGAPEELPHSPIARELEDFIQDYADFVTSCI